MSNPKAPPVVPLLVCIPYWEGDRHQMGQLVRVLAGLQPHHAGSEVHLMLVNRKDCKADPNFVKIVSPKFNIHTYTSESNLKGWPAGPNGMFGTTMIRIGNYMKGKYEAVYWMEPDAIPITPNWYRALTKAWRDRHPAANIVGYRHDCNGDGTGSHITGCALYHWNIARILPKITAAIAAWDYEHRAAIVQMGGHTNLIMNHYKARNCVQGTLDDLLRQGVVIAHGYKDDSLVNLVRLKYGIRG